MCVRYSECEGFISKFAVDGNTEFLVFNSASGSLFSLWLFSVFCAHSGINSSSIARFIEQR